MSSSARRGSLWCGLVALTALGPRLARAEPAGAEPTPSRVPPPPNAAAAAPAPDVPPPPPHAGAPSADVALPGAGSRASVSGASGSSAPETPAATSPPSVARVHDGFYARLGVGASYGRAFVQTDRVSQPDVTVTGIGPSLDLWIGWTVAPGLVLGPALSSLGAATGGAKIGAAESEGEGSATGVSLGAFLDAYPVPEDGYHFGGVLSIASLTETTESPDDTDYAGGGVGVSIFAGYDAWVAREWSLGGMLRLGGVVTRRTESIDDQDVTRQGTLYGAALLFSAVYH